MSDKPLILVVDDEPDACQFLASLLESAGYAVHACLNAPEALRFALRARPDLVLADVRMPEMDGLELAAQIKRAEPQIPVILISAFGDWPMLCEALGKGCDDLLPKPSSTATILRTVGRVLAQAAA